MDCPPSISKRKGALLIALLFLWKAFAESVIAFRSFLFRYVPFCLLK